MRRNTAVIQADMCLGGKKKKRKAENAVAVILHAHLWTTRLQGNPPLLKIVRGKRGECKKAEGPKSSILIPGISMILMAVWFPQDT